MSLFEFENSELSCIKNDFNNKTDETLKIIVEKLNDLNNKTDETLKIIVEKLNEIILNKNENENEIITDKIKNIEPIIIA